MSESLLESHLANPASKSYVPHTVRRAVTPDVRLLEDIHHGPRQHKLNGAHLSCDWSGVHSMDWLCADDATWPVYYYVPDGNGWFTLMRGQCLIFIDARTTRILSYGLQSERNYNSRVIRTLITRTCDEHGLPRTGFLFEMGLWKNSKILTGDKNADVFSWGEVELGLREFGLRFSHSTLPRSKPVERVIGALQNYMEREPGYAGRDERHDKFERFQRLKLQIKSRKADPREHLYSEPEWIERLDALCAAYNAEPQDGKMTGGLCPNDAFQQFKNPSDPLMRFDARCRYLLAHHMRPVKVTPNGITLRFGKQAYNYRNKATGRLIGQTVLAFFNPELPDILTVTDMNRDNAFCVARSQEVPRFDAPADMLAAEMARIAAHQGYAKARYRVLKSIAEQPFRANLVDAKTVELGRVIETQTAEIKAAQTQERATLAKARKAYSRLGAPLPQAALRNPEQIEAAERLAIKLEGIE